MEVVLDNVNMAFRDEESILDQIYENTLGIFLWGFKILRVFEENAYLKKYGTLQQGTYKIGL